MIGIPSTDPRHVIDTATPARIAATRDQDARMETPTSAMTEAANRTTKAAANVMGPELFAPSATPSTPNKAKSPVTRVVMASTTRRKIRSPGAGAIGEGGGGIQ